MVPKPQSYALLFLFGLNSYLVWASLLLVCLEIVFCLFFSVLGFGAADEVENRNAPLSNTLNFVSKCLH